jgi:MFS family permease
MREGLELLRENRQSRAFFLTLAQSSLGTGAGYVALLLIAYERYESPWAISIVLGADLLPAMLLGPVFGALADRWSRRWCAVAADVVRVVAFIGIALVDSFTATVAFALLAGVGTGLFMPATVAGLASISGEKRLPAATALYGASSDFGYTLGPAVAAGGLALLGAETLLAVNGATFAVSAVVLWKLSWGQTPPAAAPSPLHPARSVLGDAIDGVRLAARLRGTRTVLFAGGALLFFGGLLNVAELILATEELDAGETGFSMLVAVFGFGFIGGSLSGAKGGALPFLKRRFLAGAAIWGGGMIAAGISPTLPLALLAFAVIGFGNGAVLVYERQIIQRTVAGSSLGRIFGLRDSLTAWAFAFAFLLAGILIAALGPRTLLVSAGVGDLLICGLAAWTLRTVWLTDVQPPDEAPGLQAPVLGADARAAGQRLGTEHLPDLVNGKAGWLTLLDDMGDRGDHRRVELGSGVDR